MQSPIRSDTNGAGMYQSIQSLDDVVSSDLDLNKVMELFLECLEELIERSKSNLISRF